MSVQLLTKHHLEFLSLKGGCRGSSVSTHVKTPHCLKSHVAAQKGKKACLTYMKKVPLDHELGGREIRN